MAAAGAGGSPVGGARENLKVVVRIRPQNAKEKERKEAYIAKVRPQTVSLDLPKTKKTVTGLSRSFGFENVFNQYSTQSEIFDTMVAPVVDQVLDGFSCTVFAYGQTGTGKTYTMEGVMDHTHEAAGIIPRSIHRVFQYLQGRFSDDTSAFSVRISFLEVYNEQLIDLLSVAADDIPEEPAAGGGKSRRHTYDAKRAVARERTAVGSKLRLVAEEGTSAVKVQGQEEVLVHNEEEVFAHVSKALQKRQVAATKCNDFSSRSHAIFTMTITLKEMTASGEEEMRVGKLHLVDLAGSENIGRSGAKDGRAREAGNINQSLLVLGRVISALVEKRRHVPYRESKLTRLLQDSLGGATKTCLIATISPSSGSVEETLSTLDYAARAKRIENKPEANKKMTRNALLRTQGAEIETLQRMLTAARSKDGVHLPADVYEQLVAGKRSLENQLEELQELKLVQAAEVTALKEQLAEISAALEESRAAHEATVGQLAATEEELAGTQVALEEKTTEAEETGVVLSAHRAVGEALTGQAGTLTSSLAASVADVAGLHGKVHRAAETEAAHIAAAQAFSASAQEALQGASTTFAAELGQQAAALRSAAGEVQAAGAASAAAAGATVQQLGALSAALQGALGRVTARVKVLTGAVTDGTAAGHSELATAASAVQGEVDALAATLGASLGELLTAAGGQMAAAAEWSERSAGALSGAEADLVAFRATHCEALQGVAGSVREAGVAAGTALTAQKLDVQAFGAAGVGALHAMRDSVLAAVSAALEEAVGAGEASLGGAVEDMVARGQETASALDAALTGAAGAVEGAAEDFGTWTTAHSGVLAQEAAAVQRSLAAVQAAHGEGMDAKRAADGALQGGVAGIAAAVAAGVAAVGGALDTSATGATAGQDDVAGLVGEACAQLESDASAASAAAEAGGAAAVEAADAVAASVSAAAGGVTDASATAAAALATLGTAARAFATEGLPPLPATGATPGKREYLAPSALAAASPDAALLARYRAHKAEGASPSAFTALRATGGALTPVKVGGEAVAAASPPPAPDASEAPAALTPSTGASSASGSTAGTRSTPEAPGSAASGASGGSAATTSTGASEVEDAENAAPAEAPAAPAPATKRTGSRTRTRAGRKGGATTGLPGRRGGSKRRTRGAALGDAAAN